MNFVSILRGLGPILKNFARVWGPYWPRYLVRNREQPSMRLMQWGVFDCGRHRPSAAGAWRRIRACAVDIHMYTHAHRALSVVGSINRGV